MCANSKAAINDITYHELHILIKKACLINQVINQAYNETKQLIICETGSASPCLDLSRINLELAREIINNQVDMVILEGMGRGIHTNFYSKFKCDCLKIAVLKNAWLAKRFGYATDNFMNTKFPIIFKFEPFD